MKSKEELLSYLSFADTSVIPELIKLFERTGDFDILRSIKNSLPEMYSILEERKKKATEDENFLNNQLTSLTALAVKDRLTIPVRLCEICSDFEDSHVHILLKMYGKYGAPFLHRNGSIVKGNRLRIHTCDFYTGLGVENFNILIWIMDRNGENRPIITKLEYLIEKEEEENGNREVGD